MTHKQIQLLLLRYNQGKCTEEESAKIHKWYASLNQESFQTLDMDEREKMEERLLNNIWKDARENEITEFPVQTHWWKSWGMYSAAAASLILIIGFVFFSNRPTLEIFAKNDPILIHATAEQMQTVKNETSKEMRIILEENSVIVLSPGSSIAYPDKFLANKREVQLRGDAFFEITKNPKRPFFVYSGNLITKVLGTSFRIESKEDDKVYEVEVVTGKVSVFENKETFVDNNSASKSGNGVILTPNQKATYFLESRHLITSIVDNPVLIENEEDMGKWIFNNTPLMDIMSGLQQEYGIEIVIANEDLEKCSFTGDLSELPLYEKLDLICKSNSVAYEVKGTRILINGAGCQEHAKNY